MKNSDLPAMPLDSVMDLTCGTVDSGYLSQAERKFSTGLTKREHFAAMAMQGMVSTVDDGYVKYCTLASDAAKMADALLKALEETTD